MRRLSETMVVLSVLLPWLTWISLMKTGEAVGLTLPRVGHKCVSEEIKPNVFVLGEYFVTASNITHQPTVTVKVHLLRQPFLMHDVQFLSAWLCSWRGLLFSVGDFTVWKCSAWRWERLWRQLHGYDQGGWKLLRMLLGGRTPESPPIRRGHRQPWVETRIRRKRLGLICS